MPPHEMIEQAEETGGRVRHRLGIVGLPGFSPVPHLLMLHQFELGVTSAELNVYLNIFMHWYDAGRFPFPHTATIAKRMDTTQRKVQRIVASLVAKGMIEKIPGERKRDPKRYDVRPLLLKLEKRAKEWAALREEERPVRETRSLAEVL
jgi:DNA-binding MarR family transcriptional regulator